MIHLSLWIYWNLCAKVDNIIFLYKIFYDFLNNKEQDVSEAFVHGRSISDIVTLFNVLNIDPYEYFDDAKYYHVTYEDTTGDLPGKVLKEKIEKIKEND